MKDGELFLWTALAVAVFILWRLHRARVQTPSAMAPPQGAPPGVPYIALGQYAVDPSRQWLLITPGQ